MKTYKSTITIVTNVYLPAIGGITNYIKGLVEVLQHRGHEVHVIAFPMYIAQREDKIANRIIRRIVHELLVFAFTLVALSRIFALKFDRKPLFLHSHSASFCLGIAIFARLFGVKSLHTFHSPIESCSSRLRILLPFAPELACVSEEHLKLYAKYCNITKEMYVVPGGVDCRQYSPPNSDERTRAHARIVEIIGLPDSTSKIILFVGRITREKGVDVLLDAAKILYEKNCKVIFLVVGPLDQTKEQIKYVNNLRGQISSDINFYLVGNISQDDLLKAYQASDLMVTPSVWEEPSPMVVVEAMASGLPIIASKIGGLKSRIIDGVNGCLVSPGNSEDLANTLLELLKHPEQIEKMKKKSRNIALENYSLETMVNKYEKIYYK
ncbi:MAG: glycosyltransferase family 4 protein [Candidatus Hodarchaeota archaeon]